MNNISTEQLVILIQGVIIIVLMVAQHKSIPVDKAAELLGSAKDMASKTDSPLDDSMVNLGEWLLNLYKQSKQQPDNAIVEADNQATVQIQKKENSAL